MRTLAESLPIEEPTFRAPAVPHSNAMKTAITTLLGWFSVTTAFAQGTVNFANRVPGFVDARVMWDSGVEVAPVDARFVAQLYAGPVDGPLVAMGDPLVFRNNSDAAKGYWIGEARTIVGVEENGLAQAKVVVWASEFGATYEAAKIRSAVLGFGSGESAVITVKTGGGLTPPPPLLGLQSFTLSFVPEPSTLTLGLLGAGVLALRRGRGGRGGSPGATVEPASTFRLDAAITTVDKRSRGSSPPLTHTRAMKTLWISVGLVLGGSATYAQGTVNFANRIPGFVDARVLVYGINGYEGGADNHYVAQLYAGIPGGPLVATGDPIPFRSTSEAARGYWIGEARTIAGVAENGVAQVKVVAWATSLGNSYEAAIEQNRGGWGHSDQFTVTTGGGLTPPTPLIGLQSFTIAFVPEPTTLMIGLVGAGVLALRRGTSGARR